VAVSFALKPQGHQFESGRGRFSFNMEIIKELNYKKHVFVCVNEREEGESCCKDVNGSNIFIELKNFVINNGLVKDIWVTKTGCLGFCNDIGCTIVVYPDRVWFMQTTSKNLEEIKEFIVKDL